MEVKLYIIIISICLFMLFTSVRISAVEFEFDIYRPKENIEEGIIKANKEMENQVMLLNYFKYYVTFDPKVGEVEIGASKNIWNEYGIFAKSLNKGNYKYVNGMSKYEGISDYQYEFIANTISGDDVPNPYYPADSYPSSEIMGRWKWDDYPELNVGGRKKLISLSSRDYLIALSKKDKNEFVQKLLDGLESDYKDMFDRDMAEAEGDEAWLKRAGVVLPPTKVSRGIVRLWHSNGDWYTNVIMNPLYYFDVDFTIEEGGVDYTDGRLVIDSDKSLVTVNNTTDIGDTDITESVRWYVDGALVEEDFTPYDSTTIPMSSIDVEVLADTTVELKLVVKVKGNDDQREEIHSLEIVSSVPLVPVVPSAGTSTSIGSSTMTTLTGDLRIGSLEPGHEIYDVTKSIPTGEDIYVQVIADEYILGYTFTEHSGSKSYKATIKGSYDNGDGTTTPFNVKKSVSRSYSYYTLDSYYLYDLDYAKVYNFALGGSQIISGGTGLNAISATMTLGGIIDSPSNEKADVGIVSKTYNFTKKAKKMIDSYDTENGSLTLHNISGGKTVGSGVGDLLIKYDSTMPAVAQTDRHLYKVFEIEETLENKKGTPSSAELVYQLVSDYMSGMPSEQLMNISGNGVSVLTPVVCYPEVVDADSDGDGVGDIEGMTQTIAMDPSREQLIIGEAFLISYPLDGQHTTNPGYGDRDYRATTKERQIQFSFDVYRGSDGKGELLRAGQWHSYVEGGEDLVTEEENFYIPSWNKELAKGSMMFRTIPINSQDIARDGYGFSLNSKADQYKAVNRIDVELSSRIYGFSVTDVSDPRWMKYFDGSLLVDATALPVTPGVNTVTGYEKAAIKLGYESKFSVMTNGDMNGRDDILVVLPKYYHVDPKGMNRQEVDLYYESKAGFIQFGSDQDTMSNEMVLTKEGRMMEASELGETAKVLEAQKRGTGYDADGYLKALSSDYGLDIKYKDWLVLTEMQKTYTGELASSGKGPSVRPGHVSEEDVMASQQKWYGEFYLPNQTVAVPVGTDLSTYNQLKVGQGPFLNDGYIIVNFSIEVYHNLTKHEDIEKQTPYIVYDNDSNGNGRGNMWAMEKFPLKRFGDPFEYGDIFFYHVDKRASDDYK